MSDKKNVIPTNVINDLVDWIQDNLEQPLQIKTVASKAGYSQWHLQRMFKATVGESLASHIRMARLTKAASELRDSRITIAKLSLKYQFESQQSFCRAFKRMFAVTPSGYRKDNTR